MTYGLLHTLRCLYHGHTLLRVRMNVFFARYELAGKVVDIGGGHNPDYFSYFKKGGDYTVEAIDGSMTGIDFESDTLPFGTKSVDTVILANVLEHVYNHQHLLQEVRRILAEKGTLIGFVPFWIGYHPDPHDYFRYTHEALARMLEEVGFTDVRIHPLSVGPILANFNTIVLSLPRILRPVAYLVYAAGNAVFLALRPHAGARNPLGYVFTATP